MRPTVAMVTDFGNADGFAGMVAGVMLEVCPDLAIVDVSHEIPPGDIRHAGFVLASALTCFPKGSVFLAVVDPGVGGQRQPLALRIADWWVVAPDNGLASWAPRWQARAGRVAVRSRDGWLQLGRGVEAVVIDRAEIWREPRSSSFHGRDLFGPAAARLAVSQQLTGLGGAIDRIVDLPWPEPRAQSGHVLGEVVAVDRFGNLTTSFWTDELPERPSFEVADRHIDGLSSHYHAGPPFVAIAGSVGLVEIAARGASAARLLGVGPGAELRMKGAEQPRQDDDEADYDGSDRG
ncbi:MAG: SAM-dependent chlorinase/fluorinase [Chloroflexi bacterium]|nr:SAM-dependent chlorinase/fluorinase [Chloroflexota bacterium]